jgi:hypothetical protein
MKAGGVMTNIEGKANEYRAMLREEGYINVEFGIDGNNIDPLFDQFRELSELIWTPEGTHFDLEDALHYTIDERPKDADYFMVHRRIGEINPHSPDRAVGTDSKDLAHIGPRSMQEAKAKLGKRMPKVMREFIGSCLEIHEVTKQAVRPVYRALGMEDLMLAKNPENDIHMVRVLRYLGSTTTHKADLHFDRAVATVAAWESSPGLVGAPGNNSIGDSRLTPGDLIDTIAAANASDLIHESGKAKFFLAAGYNRLPDEEVFEKNGPLPLLAHGVLNQDPNEERDAVVVFMNPHLGVKGYVVPSPEETGLSDVYGHLINSQERAA